MSVDEGADIGRQFADTAMDGSAELLVGEVGEEAFDLVEPGRAGGREMDMPARTLGEPGVDRRRLVGGIVVHHQMDIEVTPWRL
jgi:hypothetical protein